VQIINVIQRSPEWHTARAGVITASMFSVAREKLKKSGEPTSAARSYAFGLAIERLGGMALDDTADTAYMQRGRELEPAARAAHSKAIGQEIGQLGFCKTDCGTYGCSPDGVIGDIGGAEYKCLVNADRIQRVVLNDDLSDFMDQVQGCMWIMDRGWWDFCVYLPQLAATGRDLYRKRVFRDNDYICNLSHDLSDFNSLVDDYVAKIRNSIPETSKEPF
jgi:hypothetical protein